jgi:hypothetical protein
MDDQVNPDLDRIRRFLRRLLVRDLLNRLSAAILRLAVIACVALSVNTFFVEGAPQLPWTGFGASLVGTLAFWAGLAAVVLAARPLSLPQAARRVEEQETGFRDDIVSSLTLASRLDAAPGEEGVSRPLFRRLMTVTADRLEKLRPGDFVSWRPLAAWGVRLAMVLIPVAFLVSVGSGFSPAAMRALGDPTVYWPLGKVTFDVSPGAARVARGADLPVEARVAGPAPGMVMLVRESAGEEPVRYVMETGEERLFRLVITGVQRPFRYRLSSASAVSPWFEVDVVEPPTAGNFIAHYTFPAYTGLEPRTVPVNGNLEVLRGTGVKLEFSTNKSLERGTLLLGESEYEIAHAGGNRYQVSLYLNGEERYGLQLVDGEGIANVDSLEYSIRYIPDRPPEVKILSPEGEIDLGPFSQVPVRFRARDDFGISRVSLVYRDPAGREVREEAVRGEAGRAVDEEYLWDAGSVEAPPGSLVPVFLEAADNDTISGPKVSLSNSFFLRVPDPVEEHRKTQESLEEFIDLLVDLLADELDLLAAYEEQAAAAEENWEQFPWDAAAANEALRNAVHEAALKAGSAMESLRQQMSVDPLSRQESFYQIDLMGRIHDEMMKFSLEPMRDVARSLKPGDSRREEMVQKGAFLKKYTEDAVSATEQMVLMAEEMKRERHMADMTASSEEMMDFQEEILKQLEAMEAGDREAMEEILRELAEMERMLREMVEALASQEPELPEEFLNSEALEELPLSEIMEGMEKIREMLRRGDLEGAKEAARELLKSIGDLMNRLRQAEEDFRQGAEQAANRLKRSTIPALDAMIKKQEDILNRTEDLAEKVSEEMTEGEKAEAGELSRGEGDLKDEASRLAREAAVLKSALPFLDARIESDLKGASSDMGAAEGALAGKAPGGAVPSERSALARLMSARDRARQSLQRMEQMQSLRSGKGMAFMPGWMGQAPGQSSPSRGNRSGGRMGTDIRSFRIPGKEDYKVPSLFRQEILESLREGYPSGYEDQIRDYFHRITD